MKICSLSSLANFKYNNDRLRVKYEKILKNKVSWHAVPPASSLGVSYSLSLSLSLSRTHARMFTPHPHKYK